MSTGLLCDVVEEEDRTDNLYDCKSEDSGRPPSMMTSSDCVADTSLKGVSLNADYCADMTYDKLTTLQAVVFIEDAFQYRSIHHKVDVRSLMIYRRFNSRPARIFRYVIITLLHLLAFIEFPSSLTWTSDTRSRGKRIILPCGATEAIELIFLLCLLADLCIKMKLLGRKQFLKSKWLIAAAVVLTVSLLDWILTIGLTCSEMVRVRRILRPFFLLQHSSLMKKIVNCLRRTLPEVASVLLLLGLHLYIFMLFGMLLFPTPRSIDNGNNTLESSIKNISNSTNADNVIVGSESEYFRSLEDAFFNLLVLLTTANNPDVMMPSYHRNRFYFIFFLVFLIIGLYCFMNMLTAVIYNQFRGYFLSSMQSSLFRRRLGVQAAFEVLRRKNKTCRDASSISSISSNIISGWEDMESTRMYSNGVKKNDLQEVIEHCSLPKTVKKQISEDLNQMRSNTVISEQFQGLFTAMDSENTLNRKPDIRWCSNSRLRMFQKLISHRWFTYFGNLIATINVIVITVELSYEYDTSLSNGNSVLSTINFVFVIYYLIEQLLKLWALGWWRYVYDKGNIFDAVVTIVLVIVEIVGAAKYGLPIMRSHDGQSDSVILWNILRLINILIMLRLLRIIPQIKAMSIVASTLMDLIKNLKAFGGILVVIYYSFAIVGMELFRDKIEYVPKNKTNSSSLLYQCGTYQQLEYYANNFDDFAAAIVVLWDIMVVNNWHVFLNAYANATNRWSWMYFIIWWLLSVVIILNLFTALILENFIMKWDRSSQVTRERTRSGTLEESNHFMTVYLMFRSNLKEPEEDDLKAELEQHSFLQLDS